MAKNPGGQQANTKGSKADFARSSGGGGGIRDFFSNLFSGGSGGGAPQNRMPDGSRMDTITKQMGAGKTAPNYGQVNLGMAAPGTPGLEDKLALNSAAMQAAQQPGGIMDIIGNFMPGMSALNAARGAMKHMRPGSFPPRYGPDGQMTPYGMQMQQNSQLLAQQMAARGGDGPSVSSAPPVPEVAVNTMPTERPSWWPAYMAWPPNPDSAMGQYAMAGGPTSVSSLYYGGAINSMQNPMNMGIGGLPRRT